MQDLTSDRIIEYLHTHPPSSTREMASALLLTKADIRYHLKHLQKVGLVTRSIRHHARGAGRPGYYYSSTSDDPLTGYRLIARLLSSILFDNKANILTEDVLDKIVDGISGNFHNDDLTGTQRISAAVQYLIGSGYQAAWEARPDHPIVLLRNCPYLDLALEQPKLCQADCLLIEKLTAWKCEQNQRIRDNIQQISACRFSLITSQ